MASFWATLLSIVTVTFLFRSLEKSVRFQVTSVALALAVPLTLAEPSVTFALGSTKVHVGITFQSVKGGGAEASSPAWSLFAVVILVTRSFSSSPKSSLNNPFESAGSITERMTMPLMPPELSSISANHRYSPAFTLTVTVRGWPSSSTSPASFLPA